MADTTKLIIELEILLRNLDKTLRGLDQVKRKLDSVASVKFNQRNTSTAVDRQVLATQRLQIQQQKLQLQQQRLTLQSQQLAAQTQRVTTAQNAANLATQRLTLAQQRLGLAQQRFAQAQQRFIQGTNTAGQAALTTQRHLNTLSAAALRVGGGLRSLGLTASVTLTAPLTALVTIATRNAVEFDSLRRGLEVMAGSSAEAARQLERLKEIAKAPGIGFQEAIQGSIRLQAVGFSARDAEKALIQFANAVALTGGGREELSRITVQLGQLAAKGKVVAQDLKPIIEAGPAVGQALVKAFGTVNSEDIQKLGLSTQEFFDRLIAALTTLPRAAAGAKNAFENFSDSVFRASLALGDAILPPLTKIAEFIEPVIQQLADAFRQLPQSVQLAVIGFGALVAAAGPILFVLGGITSGIGAIGTAIAALLPILSSIGLPAIAAILAGLAITVGELTAAVAALGLAWRSNFLGIRELATSASAAIVGAVGRIRAILTEAAQRILPTLQSITTRVLSVTSALWERYGKVIVQIVGDAFHFVVGAVETFLRAFTNLVDLVLKLVDGDWRGAWRAFARLVVNAVDGVISTTLHLQTAVIHALDLLLTFILLQAIKFGQAARELGLRFTVALALEITAGVPRVRDAIATMFLLAASGVALGPIAEALVARFIAELRKAAGEGVALPVTQQQNVGVDVGLPESGGRSKFAPKAIGQDKGAERQRRANEREARRLRDAQDKFAEQGIENQIALTRAGIQQQFELTRDGLERENRLLDDAFEDRLKSVKAFFAERKRIQEAEIDAELVREKSLSNALVDEFALRRRQAETEFQSTLTDIREDSRLKGRARQLAIQTAEQQKQTAISRAQNEFEVQNAEISTRILQLQKAREDVAHNIARAEAELTRELQKQRDEVRFSLLEEQGLTADAETGRLKQRFTDTIRDLRIDISSLSLELQNAINGVDLSTLQQQLDRLPEPVRVLTELLDIGIKRVQIAESQRLVEDLSAGLRLDETQIQNKVLDGLISQREAQAQIVAIQQKYRALLLDILQGELAKAEAIKDQSVITAIKQQIAETERLGIAVDEVGQQINQAFISDIQSGISGIFSGARKGFEGLRDAAISFGERLLDTLNDVAATSIVKQLEGLFKPDAANTTGTIGGFFSKLFGLGPAKQADAAAASATLQSGAVGAAAALSTGITTASATFTTSVVTAATSFASTVLAAAAGFAATIGAASAAGAAGGIGSAFGGFAATGMFPAVPGGAIRIVEGGFPEAVLTTDPRHAVRQVAILRQFLHETRGLGGRIKAFAAGGFTNQLDISVPQISSSMGNVGEMAVAGTPSTMKLRQVLVDQRDWRNEINSPEGEQVLVDFLYKKQHVIRKLSGK